MNRAMSFGRWAVARLMFVLSIVVSLALLPTVSHMTHAEPDHTGLIVAGCLALAIWASYLASFRSVRP